MSQNSFKVTSSNTATNVQMQYSNNQSFDICIE